MAKINAGGEMMAKAMMTSEKVSKSANILRKRGANQAMLRSVTTLVAIEMEADSETVKMG